MIERVEYIVVGAGVVGLAVARALAQAGREVVILEAADAIGTGTSSRNSEVIHAGIYYAKNSLKARLCVRGKKMLYDYCRDHNVGHKRTGKLIVAAEPDEIPVLHGLMKRASDNGVDDLLWLEAGEAVAMEPELSCVAAVESPSTGIIDSHGLMLAYLGDAESHGAALVLNSPLLGGHRLENGFRLRVGSTEGEPTTIDCHGLVNAAGLFAQQVAAAIDGLDPRFIPRRHLSRGCYFCLPGRRPFKRLIYPVPTAVNLGIHLTVDLDGQARFGPDAEWVDEIDYNVDPRRADAFYDAVRRYYPALPDGELQPAYAGIRPKIQAPGEPPVDFMIQGPAVHGIGGLVNLFGMESPGLTASLAIGHHVSDLLRAQ